MAEMPRIDQEKCDRCGLCISVCDCGAIVLIGDTITMVETEHCSWCTMCEVVCLTGALTSAFEIVIEGR